VNCACGLPAVATVATVRRGVVNPLAEPYCQWCLQAAASLLAAIEDGELYGLRVISTLPPPIVA